MAHSMKPGHVYRALLVLTLLNSFSAYSGQSVFLPNINKTVTGTDLGGGHYGLDISGTISATNPSVGTNNSTAPTSSTEVGIIDGTGKLQGVSSTNPLPITGTISASNPSVSATGSAVPASATMAGGSDGTNLRALKVSTTGVLSVDGSAVTQPVSAASLPLPSGASTEATLSALNGKVTAVNTGSVTIVSSALPTGAATETTLSALNTKVTTTANGIKVDGSAVTQPVSAASLPLPTGAATETSLSGLNAKVADDYGSSSGAVRTAAQIGNTTGAAAFGAGNSSAQTLRVVVATDQAAVATKAPTSATPSLSSGNATTTATAVTAPANTTEVMIMALDTNTANLRVAFGTTCSSSTGWQLQPGRAETLHVNANASICSESGTQGYVVQWIAQ